MAFRRFCEAIVEGNPIEVFGDGRQSRDFTFVGDIVAATRAAGAADTARRAGVQRRRWRERERQPRAGDARGIAGRPLDVRHSERQEGDVPTPAPTRPAPGRSSGSRRGTALQDGLAAELEWVRERALPVPGCAA